MFVCPSVCLSACRFLSCSPEHLEASCCVPCSRASHGAACGQDLNVAAETDRQTDSCHLHPALPVLETQCRFWPWKEDG
ncbi:hypothetical protein J3F84DRAFT_380506, partial [Trichoderma pleuroticola]